VKRNKYTNEQSAVAPKNAELGTFDDQAPAASITQRLRTFPAFVSTPVTRPSSCNTLLTPTPRLTRAPIARAARIGEA